MTSWPVLAVLAVGVALRVGLLGLDPAGIARHGPVVDDTYYYFGIARNLLQGRGVTHDGVHPTAGFHPVWLAVVTGAVALGGEDPYLPVAILTMFQVALAVATGLAIYRVAARGAGPRGALYALAGWSTFPPFVAESVNGLETGLACLAAVCGLWAHLAWVEAAQGRPSARRAVAFGCLCGLMVLTRLDLGLWAAVLGARWLWRGLARPARAAAAQSVGLATATGLALVLPWFAFVFHQTGGLLPESGEATRTLALAYGMRPGPGEPTYVDLDSPPRAFYEAQVLAAARETLTRPALWPVSVLTTAAREALGVPRTSGGLAALGGLLAGAWLAWRVWRRARGPSGIGGAGRALGPLVLALSVVFLSAYSFFVFGSWWFGRYFTPLMTLWLLYSALPVERGLAGLRRRFGPAAARAAVVLLVGGAVTWGVAGRETSLGPLNPTDPYWRTAETLDAVLPPGTRVGAFQSGTLGWASRHVVVNLDGVVHRDASRAIREGRVLQAALDEGVECIVDWPWVLRDLLFRRSRPDLTVRLRLVLRSTMDLVCIERTPAARGPPE